MRNEIGASILIFIFLMIVLYIATSFITWDLNIVNTIREMSGWGRFGYGILIVLCIKSSLEA